jgi:excisionase family DNA binding protein
MKNPMSPSLTEKKYKVPEAAELLRFKEATVRKWILLQRIAVYRVGKMVLIPESEIKRILEDGFRPAKS